VIDLVQEDVGRASERPGGSARGPTLRLLEVEPELGDALEAGARETLARVAVPSLHLWPGRWDPPRGAEAGAIGLLLVDGLVLRRLRFGPTHSTELLGPGDLLRPWLEDHDGIVAAFATWEVLEPTRLAILAGPSSSAICEFPSVVAELLDRSLGRARRQGVVAAIACVTRVESRLMLTFGYLAERFGRVTSQGVAIDLDLTHATLAELIGARRPTVTTALGELRKRGLVEKPEPQRSRWLLTQPGYELLRSGV
jgi:hypothetical protein